MEQLLLDAENCAASLPDKVPFFPWNMESDKAKAAIVCLTPLCTFCYSATHRNAYDLPGRPSGEGIGGPRRGHAHGFPVFVEVGVEVGEISHGLYRIIRTHPHTIQASDTAGTLKEGEEISISRHIV